jgi:ADP-ribose pyrophosphatase YjhB (NUDIX family)
MLKKVVSRTWKLLSPNMRAKLVRSTQSSFTVSAAAIVTNGEGKILLLNHLLRPDSGWGYPGGFVNKGEQAEDAIRRELDEETGIELTELRLNSIHTSGSGTHIEILFTAQAIGEATVRSREIVELGWFDLEQLPEEMSRPQKQRIKKTLADSYMASREYTNEQSMLFAPLYNHICNMPAWVFTKSVKITKEVGYVDH